MMSKLVVGLGAAGVVGMICATWVAAQPSLEAGGSPVYGVTLPEGYRNWHFISVAHEAGKLNDIRAVFGNDIAAKTFRDGTRPFPDGAVILRMAWAYTASKENDAVFPEPQSFVAGQPTNIQVEVKDSKRYASTSGWGYGQFENGKPNASVALINSCSGCHAKANSAYDHVFTSYAPSP